MLRAAAVTTVLAAAVLVATFHWWAALLLAATWLAAWAWPRTSWFACSVRWGSTSVVA